MAVLKEVEKSYKSKAALKAVLNYIMDKSVAVEGGAVNPHYAAECMLIVKDVYHKTAGRQIRHFVLSFSATDDMDLACVCQINRWITALFMERFQIVSAVHTDTNLFHIHFVINTVSYLDGMMYAGGYSMLSWVKQYLNSYYPELVIRIVWSAES